MRTKALQWQKTSDTVLCWAHTVLGSYRVWKIGADGEWDWSFEGYDTRETFIGKVPTEEAAKLAAQAHFDAAIASVLEDDAPTHRHKKRGTEYVLIGYGKMQAEEWYEGPFDKDYVFHSSVDMREVAIYRSVDDGALWVRPREEFEDGRFIPSPPKAGE